MLNSNEIADDGFRVTEFGAFRFRVQPRHEAEVILAIRRRWLRESSVGVSPTISGVRS